MLGYQIKTRLVIKNDSTGKVEQNHLACHKYFWMEVGLPCINLHLKTTSYILEPLHLHIWYLGQPIAFASPRLSNPTCYLYHVMQINASSSLKNKINRPSNYCNQHPFWLFIKLSRKNADIFKLTFHRFVFPILKIIRNQILQ